MADPGPIDRARNSLTERAELPGMSLMEHLEELRKRILRSLASSWSALSWRMVFTTLWSPSSRSR